MFENLTHHLSAALKTLKGQGKITEINIASTLKEIRRALISADVHYKVAKDVTHAVKIKAIGSQVMTSVSPGQLFTKIVQEELTSLMGGEHAPLRLRGHPAIVLVAGLQGAGKTTFCGKLAAYVKKQGQGVLLAACDVYRPAAVEQLQVLAQQVGVEAYAEPACKKPLDIAQRALAHARSTHKSTLIVDTAGRLAIDNDMMDEVAALKRMLQPTETLFVVDAMTGQDAVQTAKAFDERIDFDGVVLTKLDGDSRGGAALSIRTVVHKPIKLIGTGEKLSDLDVFHPARMASRILGMGDVISLVERAEQVYSQEQARRLNKKLHKNAFDFNDLLEQLQQLKKMGSVKDLIAMIPGASKFLPKGEVDEGAFRSFEVMIGSMTPAERADPSLLDRHRKSRIARGSGLPAAQVAALLKQFEQMRKTMQQAKRRGGLKSLFSS